MAECMEGLEYCDSATRPDPRLPKLGEGEQVLCEDCYQLALDEMAEEIGDQR